MHTHQIGLGDMCRPRSSIQFVPQSQRWDPVDSVVTIFDVLPQPYDRSPSGPKQINYMDGYDAVALVISRELIGLDNWLLVLSQKGIVGWVLEETVQLAVNLNDQTPTQ